MKPNKDPFVIFASPVSGTLYLARDGSLTGLRSEAAQFPTVARARAFSSRHGIQLDDGRFSIGQVKLFLDQKEDHALSQMIATFMKASTKVEVYLQQDRPLDKLKYDNISTTIMALQTMLTVWERKNQTSESASE